MVVEAQDRDPLTIGRHELTLIHSGLDNIDQGITIFDEDLTLVFANRRFRELLDLPASVVKRGASFEEIVRYNAERGEYGPGDPDKQVGDRVELARQFRAHTIERSRGDGIVLRISGQPLVEGGFATIYTDITQERRRELALKDRLEQRSAALRQNQERLSLVANELPAGIAYLDQDQIFRYTNVRFAQAYQLTSDQVVGMSVSEVLSPKTFEAVTPFFELARGGEAVDFDLPIDLPDGRALEVRTFLRPDSSATGFYLMSVNVGKHKQAAALLLQAQKMDALGQLSSGIAHDFNNLLMVVLGNLVPLEERLEPADREELLLPALRAARRGADLTKRILAVARRQPLEPTAVDLEETVRNLAKLVERSLPEGIELDIAATGAPIWAFADRAQLETVLLNLIVNARDALENSGRIKIDVTPRSFGQRDASFLHIAPGNYVEISCADDGCGIPSEITKRVFEPFFSTKTEGQGSGLGLALAYGFVRESKGHIEIESEEGRGTEVRILLPAATPVMRKTSEVEDETWPIEARLVLLVDDDESIRRVLRRDLVALGLQVVEAGSADEALGLLEVLEGVDVVLSDIAMPGSLSGLDLKARIAALWPRLPVLLMTGHGVDILDATTMQDRQPVLQKPFDREVLARALRALGQQRLG